MGRFSWIKLFINLLVIASLIAAAIIGYRAFTHKLTPVVGSVIFLVSIGLFIWFVSILHRPSMRYRKPSFMLVFWSLAGITLVCTFAGVQPLSTYKDSLFNSISTSVQNIRNSAKSTSSATINQPLLIPYGIYTNTVMGISSTIILKSDGTCSVDSVLTGKVVGTYTVSSDYITIYDPITHEPNSLRYRYLDKFKCLYIGEGDQPMPFYRQ